MKIGQEFVKGDHHVRSSKEDGTNARSELLPKPDLRGQVVGWVAIEGSKRRGPADSEQKGCVTAERNEESARITKSSHVPKCGAAPAQEGDEVQYLT